MPWLRLFFNTAALALGLGLAALFLSQALRQAPPPYRSLAQGRALVEAEAIPDRDPLVYTAQAGQIFDSRSWVLDVSSFLTARADGLGAVRFFDWGALLLGLGGLAAASFRRAARPFSSVLCIAAAAWVLRGLVAPGASLWAWAFACASLACLEGSFWEAFFNRWVYLAPIALLWTNVHPSAWLLVPVLWAWVALEGQAADPLRPEQAGLAKGATAALLLVVLCLNPAPWASLRLGWQSLGSSPLLAAHIAGDQGALLFLVAALFVLVASSWTRGGREAWSRDVALFGLGALASLLSRDALPFAVAYAVPMSAQRADLLVDALPKGAQALRWPLKVAAMGALFFWIGSSPGHRPWALTEAGAALPVPKKVLAFYEQELLNEKLLCPPEWAGAVAWHLAPNVLLALDERGAAVSGRLAATNLQATLRAEGAWRETLLGAQVEACLLPLGSPLALGLARAAQWQPVAFDDVGVLYVRNLPPVADLIHAQAPRGLRPGDPAQAFDPGRLTQADADLEARLVQDPDLGVLYFYAAELAQARDQDARARQLLEQGIQRDPGFAPNYLRLAVLRRNAGMQDQVEPLLQRAKNLSLAPDWHLALAQMGGD